MYSFSVAEGSNFSGKLQSYLFTKLRGVTIYKAATIIFTGFRTSNFTITFPLYQTLCN